MKESSRWVEYFRNAEDARASGITWRADSPRDQIYPRLSIRGLLAIRDAMTM